MLLGEAAPGLVVPLSLGSCPQALQSPPVSVGYWQPSAPTNMHIGPTCQEWVMVLWRPQGQTLGTKTALQSCREQSSRGSLEGGTRVGAHGGEERGSVLPLSLAHAIDAGRATDSLSTYPPILLEGSELRSCARGRGDYWIQRSRPSARSLLMVKASPGSRYSRPPCQFTLITDQMAFLCTGPAEARRPVLEVKAHPQGAPEFVTVLGRIYPGQQPGGRRPCLECVWPCPRPALHARTQAGSKGQWEQEARAHVLQMRCLGCVSGPTARCPAMVPP